jgi:hypothetical protein
MTVFDLIALMMEAARTSETLVNFYQTTRRYNQEDSHLSMILVCVGSILISCGLLYRMPGGYSTTRLCVPQFGYGSEIVCFHVIACKINYTNDEQADMHLILGEASGNSAEAEQLYTERFPNRRTQSRHFERQL